MAINTASLAASAQTQLSSASSQELQHADSPLSKVQPAKSGISGLISRATQPLKSAVTGSVAVLSEHYEADPAQGNEVEAHVCEQGHPCLSAKGKPEVTAAQSKTDIAAEWSAKADKLLPGQVQTDNGEKLTAADCYKKALQANSTHAQAWIGLARQLQRGGKTQVNGESFTQSQCFAMANIVHKVAPQDLPASLNKKHIDTFHTSIFDRPSKTFVDTIRPNTGAYDKRRALIQALNTSPKNAEKWEALAASLGAGEQAGIGRGVSNAQHSYINAIESGSKRAEPWIGVGRLLQSGGSAIINDRKYTQAECFEKAASLMNS